MQFVTDFSAQVFERMPVTLARLVSAQKYVLIDLRTKWCQEVAENVSKINLRELEGIPEALLDLVECM